MSDADQTEAEAWTPKRWVIFCLLMFVLQLGVIFWLGERKPISARPAARAPVLSLALNRTSESIALQDPTLFALPRKQGFAGLAWLAVPTQQLPAVEWTAEPSWHELTADQLGQSLQLLGDANLPSQWRAPAMPDPEPGWRPETVHELSFPSAVRVIGGAPVPRLVTPINLPAWPPKMLSSTDADLLTNSVVEVMVGVDGRPLSATLLAGSGSKAADDFALIHSWQARFDGDATAANPTESSPDLLSQLRWCRLVFEWETRPETDTTAGTP